jgi:hypothetical protein
MLSGKGGTAMTNALYEPPVRDSFWTAEAGLRHSRGFRVELPDRLIGYVEEVIFDDAEEDVEQLLVYGSAGRRRISVDDIDWVDVRRELIRLDSE